MSAGLNIQYIAGNCPVEGEGTVDGQPFYFRARGDSWAIGIGGDPIGNAEWRYTEDYGDSPFAAGWMSEAEAEGFIRQAVARWRAEKKNS